MNIHRKKFFLCITKRLSNSSYFLLVVLLGIILVFEKTLFNP